MILSKLVAQRLCGKGAEANVATTYDGKQYGQSQHYVLSEPLLGLLKIAHLPALEAGEGGYAGQGHYHENGEPISAHDFSFSNTLKLPVSMGVGGQSNMYIPLATAREGSPSNAGVIISY